MKRAVFFSALMLIFAGQSRAQFEQGRSEISFLGSLGSYSIKETSRGSYNYSYSQSSDYLSFATTYDYYVTNGFSEEVSLICLKPDSTQAYSRRDAIVEMRGCVYI